MVANDLRTSGELALARADVITSPRIDLAWRHHVPPLVEERGPVTVVVANHEPLPNGLWSYAQALSALLGGQLRRATVSPEAGALSSTGLGDSDLIILGKGSTALLRHLLARGVEDQAARSPGNGRSVGVLAAQKPRMPLERILLVLCGGEADQAAVDWSVRLARPSAATVTVLAVVPSVQAMYHGLARMRQSLRSVLSSDTPLGRQMRETAQRLVESDVPSALRLRQGAHEHEICREVAEGRYDLAIMATKPCRWWLRQLKGDPICSMLSWVDRPVLFVEPRTE